MFQPKYVNIFTCSSIVLSVTIFPLIGTCPLNVISSGSSGDIIIPYYFVVVCEAYNALCKSYT